MLKINKLSKSFAVGTINEHHALKQISLDVRKGDFITIIGSNGSGKSTLFNCIAGTLLPDEGKICLDGRDVTLEEEHLRARKIGRLFQDPLKGTAPHMTVIENLALAYLRSGKNRPFATVSGKDREFFLERLKELKMGLEEDSDKQVGLLSGGQRQALTLLMATIVPPQLLLLDEHTAALDPRSAETVMELTEKTVREKGITCLMITNNLSQALKSGNRILMMREGRIISDLSAKEKQDLSEEDLLKRFREDSGRDIDNDRILFSAYE